MAEIIISPTAKRELREIGIYTEKQWGRQQRQQYVARLNNRVLKSAEHPTYGRQRHNLPGAPYSYHEGRHVIFYRIVPNGIEVIRVLHDAVDFPRRFSREE